MSQLEHKFRALLGHQPEIEKCYASGLVNRRALARYLVQNGIAQKSQFEACIAMLRRYPFQKTDKESLQVFRDMRTALKDDILILDFEKDKALLEKLQKLIEHTDYDRGDTLKIVVGSSSITLFLDRAKEKDLEPVFEQFRLIKKHKDISEISLAFPKAAIDTKGVLSIVTRELYLNGILITEMLTASSELLVYVQERQVLEAYRILKALAKPYG
ncbi:MAG: hypothetical protein HY519_03430 [Candidatus Aenigmarchaeota archaeon]|nr:hypothetical protein [Candidatus Aenigmarchaeota archaeon]